MYAKHTIVLCVLLTLGLSIHVYAQEDSNTAPTAQGGPEGMARGADSTPGSAGPGKGEEEALESLIEEVLDPYFIEALTDAELEELSKLIKKTQANRAQNPNLGPQLDTRQQADANAKTSLSAEVLLDARRALESNEQLRNDMRLTLEQLKEMDDNQLGLLLEEEDAVAPLRLDFPRLKARISAYRELYSISTPHQEIAVYKAPFFGMLMSHDRDLTLVEHDHWHYHEMLAHAPLVHLPSAQRALILGGGDGGALQQVLQYPNIGRIDVVEIDAHVTNTSKHFYPQIGRAFYSKRAHIRYEPAEKFIADACANENLDKYDVVIVDVGEGKLSQPIFTLESITNIKECLLKKGGILSSNIGTGWGLNAVAKRVKFFKQNFEHAYLFQIFQPTYPSGHYLCVFASDAIHPSKTEVNWKHWIDRGIPTRYYNPELHYQSFILPNFVRAAAPWSKVSLSEVPHLYDPDTDGAMRYPPRITVQNKHFLGENKPAGSEVGQGAGDEGREQGGEGDTLLDQEGEENFGGLDPHDAPKADL